MKHFLFRSSIALGLLLVPLAALAGTNITVTAPMAASGGSTKNYTVSGSADSVTLSSSEMSVTMSAGQSLTITSPDSTILTYPSSGIPSVTRTCSTTFSLAFSIGSGGQAETFTITPSTATCGGGGSSPSSSGGTPSSSGGTSPTRATTPTPTPTPAPAPTPAPTTAPATAFGITSDLAFGSQSNEVAQLQTYLATDKTFYPQGLVTGYFGPATQAAVKRFQSKYGLPQVGRVGPATRAKLAEVFAQAVPPAPAPEPTPQAPSPAPAPAPTPAPAAGAITKMLQVGSRGNDVTTLQTLLAQDKEVYPEGLVTGYFGPATQAAVKRFQAKHAIEAIGIVGPLTRAKVNELLGAPAPAAPAPAPAPTPAPEPIPTPTPTPAADDAAKIKALLDQLKILQDQLNKLQGQ